MKYVSLSCFTLIVLNEVISNIDQTSIPANPIWRYV